MHDIDMVNGTQLVDRGAQMSFEWEFPPDIQQETTEYETALRRWEDDGGALAREDTHGE